MDQGMWIVFFEQNENVNNLVPANSEVRITEDAEFRLIQDNEERITEGNV